ncbi:MAG: hypothetical protein AAGH68_15375 [Pseudomonadota bacterium]
MSVPYTAEIAPLFVDTVRFVHLGAMAVGLGTMVSTDLISLKRADRPVTEEYCRAVHAAHAIMAPALIAAWVSGLFLLVIRTGLDLDAFTPKLWAKLVVVTLLTLTAFAVKRLVMPVLSFNLGRTLMEAPRGDKLIMAICAALSMSGWGCALMLGAVGMFANAPGWALTVLLIGIYGSALNIAVWHALRLHDRVLGDQARFSRMV